MHLNPEQIETWRKIARLLVKNGRMEWDLDDSQGKELLSMLNDVAAMAALREEVQKFRDYAIGPNVDQHECDLYHARINRILFEYLLIPQDRVKMGNV